MVDPKYTAWHAGKRKWNTRSVGIDLSNGFYTKYNKHYEKKGFGKRPIHKNVKVHSGTIKECLGYYPEQIKAYKALVKCLCTYYNIPVDYPHDSDGGMVRKVYAPAAAGTFKGIVSHFHLTKRKIDCAQLDLEEVLRDL